MDLTASICREYPKLGVRDECGTCLEQDEESKLNQGMVFRTTWGT